LRRFTAGVAELVDALDLGSSATRRGGSSPFARTKNQTVRTPQVGVRTVLKFKNNFFHYRI
jgi:hypothetical protein